MNEPVRGYEYVGHVQPSGDLSCPDEVRRALNLAPSTPVRIILLPLRGEPGEPPPAPPRPLAKGLDPEWARFYELLERLRESKKP